MEEFGFRRASQGDDSVDIKAPSTLKEESTRRANEKIPPALNRSLPDVAGSVPSSSSILTLLRDEGGGLDLVDIDVSTKASFTNNLIFCTARSPAHVSALADLILRELRSRNVTVGGEIVGVSGGVSRDWAVVDVGLIVIHILLDETRRMYNIEALWTKETTPEEE